MSLEGKQERTIATMVYCKGVNGMVVEDTCQECEHFGGYRTEPIIQREMVDKKRVEKQIGENKWVLCCIPKLEKVLPLYEVK